MPNIAGENRASVPARYYSELPHLLGRKNIDANAVFNAAGLSLSQLTDQQARLELVELENLVIAMASVSQRSELPVELGELIHLRDHNLVGYALISSPSIDYGLRLTARFFRLVFPAFRMQYRVVNDLAEITYTPTMAMSQGCLAFHIELLTVATLTTVIELVQHELPPYDIDMSIPAPPHASYYRKVLPEARMDFGSLKKPGISIRLPVSVVQKKPVMANQEVLRVAEERCRMLQEQITGSGDVGAWVRMMLRESHDGLPGIDELAATLNRSVRTLSRYLAKEGLVYRTLCVEERDRRGKELLLETRLSITAVALELGYTATSNFTRAFTRRNKCSPIEYRGQNRSSG